MIVRRTTEISVDFDPETGLAYGWEYSVLSAFSRALDISYTSRKDKKTKETLKVKTEGETPRYAFGAGDTFYKPAIARILSTPEASKIMTDRIQVLNATPQEIEVRHTVFSENTENTLDYSLTQNQFAKWLKSGVRPDTLSVIRSKGFFLNKDDPSVEKIGYDKNGIYVGKTFKSLLENCELVANKIHRRVIITYGAADWVCRLESVRHLEDDIFYLYCFPSGEPNPINFRSDRIIKLVDCSTGEVIETESALSMWINTLKSEFPVC